MADDSTIFQHFKALELQEKQKNEACIEAIKIIHAAGPDLSIETPPVRSVPLAMEMRYSQGGRFIGWYRDGQKVGRPSRITPIEKSLEKMYQNFKKSVVAAFPKSITGKTLGILSGVARKERGLFFAILDMEQQLIDDCSPKHHHPKLIAKALGCNTEFVRRTLREIKRNK